MVSINKTQFIPALMILLDVATGVVCGVNGDARRCIYWIAAAVITAAVTF